MNNLKADVSETGAPRQISSKRRRWRFSLRSLLIVCTLVALLLGAFMHRVRTQKQAVAEIRNLYGHVDYETNWLARVLPESIKKRLGKDFYANVVSVTLSRGTINRRMVPPTDAEWEQMVDAISRLPHVTKLNIHDLSLQNENVFAGISKIDSLQTLSLSACHFDGEHLRQLQKMPNFTKLILHNIAIEPQALLCTMDDSDNDQSIGFPFVPTFQTDFGFLVEPSPGDRYHQWLNKILPNVEVFCACST